MARNTATDDQEFDEIEQRLEHASKTFKLNLLAIKQLDKKTSNKFVLPLSESVEDIEKWNQLVKQPFSFLEYNSAKFSLNMRRHRLDSDFLSDEKEMEEYTKSYQSYSSIRDKIEAKREYYLEMQKRLTQVRLKLEQQVVDLKEQFEQKAAKHKQPKLLKFLAERTKINIGIIRKAEKTTEGRLRAMKNKRLSKYPDKFFKRAVRWFLGSTGDDVLKDMEQLNLTSKEDYLLAIEYLWFLMTVLAEREKEDQFYPPVVMIADSEDYDKEGHSRIVSLGEEDYEVYGFKKSNILKILAGHMFIHTITTTNKAQQVIDDMIQYLDNM